MRHSIFKIFLVTLTLLSVYQTIGQFRTGVIQREWAYYQGDANYGLVLAIFSYPEQPADTSILEYYGYYSGGILIDSVLTSNYYTLPFATNVTSEFQPCLNSSTDSLLITLIDSNDNTILPPNDEEGYQLIVDLNQNSPEVLNIVDPEINGSTMLMHFYIWEEEPEYYPINSVTGVLNINTGITACVGEPFQHMFGHTPTLIDSLFPDLGFPWDQEFSLITPLKSSNTENEYLNPTYTMESYEWNEGYSIENPLGGTSEFTFSEEGLLQGIAYEPGIYTVGIRVDFGVDGNSEGYFITNYDIEVVDDCSPIVLEASIFEQPPEDICSGLEVALESLTENATSYLWDFGDENTETDFSMDAAPIYSYSEEGDYEITLIANPNTSCADTAYTEITVQNLTFQTELSDVEFECFDGQYIYSLSGSGYPEEADLQWNLPDPFPNHTIVDDVLTITDPPQGSFVVSLAASTGGCTSEAYTNIGFISSESTELVPQTEFCEGLEYEFELINSSLYDSVVWDFGVDQLESDTSTLSNPTYTYLEEGLYTASLITNPSSSCADTTTLEVFIQIPPFQTELSDLEFNCIDEQSTYNIEATGYPEGSEIEWSLPLFFPEHTIDGNELSVINPDQNSFEVAFVATSLGCASEATSILTFNNPFPEFIPQTEFCAGLEYEFGMIDTTVYDDISWDFGVLDIETDTSSLNSPSFVYPSAGVYQVTASTFGANICSQIDTLEISVNETLEISYTTNSPQCLEQNNFEITLNSEISENATVAWLQFDEATSEFILTENTQSLENVSYISTGIQTVLFFYDEFGCSLLEYIPLEVLENPSIQVTPTEVSGCGSLQVEFNAVLENVSDTSSIVWASENEILSNEISVSQTFDNPGDYTVNFSLLESPCPPTSGSTFTSLVSVYEIPESSFELSSDTLFWPENSVTITSLANSENCVFTLGNGDLVEDCNATIFYDEPGTYEITQVVSNDFLCETSSTQYLTIIPKVEVPNVISPDNDGNTTGVYSTGLNDGWHLAHIEYLGHVEVSIFNRWGELVYANDSYSNETPFIGLDQNGNELNEGVYFYTLETSKGQSFTGSLTILRN